MDAPDFFLSLMKQSLEKQMENIMGTGMDIAFGRNQNVIWFSSLSFILF